MKRRTLALTTLIMGIYVATTMWGSTASAQKNSALTTNERIKIFPLNERKIATSETTVNDWLKEKSPKILSIKLIPAHDEGSALVVHYEAKGTDARSLKVKFFEQDGTPTNFEECVNTWLDKERATIVARDVTLALHHRHETWFQAAYITAK